jgi:pantetheine-phosphate adenylyltransferase
LVRAIYPGKFDPITRGHIDIARRASLIFDEVIVAVYGSTTSTLFTTEERVSLASQSLADLPNVQVMPYTGLTVDFAQQASARVIVRGLRAVSDFEVEMQMALMNRKMAPDLEVVCLMTSLQYSFLSATLIKEIVRMGGPSVGLVTEPVARALRQKYGHVDTA